MENYTPQEPDNKDTLERSGWKIYLTHPTNLPMTGAILYFLIVGGMTLSFPQLGDSKDSKLFGVFMLPFLFLFGLSGFLNVITKTTVRLRYIWHGIDAYLDSVPKLLVGWGGFIYILYHLFK